MKKLPIGLRVALLALERSKSKVKMGAALIYSNGRIVAACNNDKSSPGASRWYKYYEAGTHAEYNLISRSMLNELPIKGVCFVARLLANGEFGLARPCSSCRAMLRGLGIRKIVFTVTKDQYQEERL
jgi:deoxycytidylate deaminase